MRDYDHIPTFYEVLTDDDKVANLYCAIKWLVWQLVYVTLVILGVPVLTALIIGAVVLFACGLPFYVLYEWAKEYEQVNTAASKTTTAVKNAPEKPVARRVYNRCPVMVFETGPRWFERATDWVDEKLFRA